MITRFFIPDVLYPFLDVLYILQYVLYLSIHVLYVDNQLDLSELNFEGEEFESENEAYVFYNDYAYRLGFGIRRSKNRLSQKTKKMTMRQFCCWREGYKVNKETEGKAHTNIDSRLGCKAMIKFSVSKEGIFTCTQHITKHNHDPVPPSQRHEIRSQRIMTKNQISYVERLVKSGIRYVDAVRALKREAGGTPYLLSP